MSATACSVLKSLWEACCKDDYEWLIFKRIWKWGVNNYPPLPSYFLYLKEDINLRKLYYGRSLMNFEILSETFAAWFAWWRNDAMTRFWKFSLHSQLAKNVKTTLCVSWVKYSTIFRDLPQPVWCSPAKHSTSYIVRPAPATVPVGNEHYNPSTNKIYLKRDK